MNLFQTIRDNGGTAKYADLLLLDAAGMYEDEFCNYSSPNDDSVISYYAYSSQRLERDTKKYGNGSVFYQIYLYLGWN